MENRTNEDKNYEMTSLNLETQGGSTGISALFLSILKDEDGESLQGHGIIKPGERKRSDMSIRTIVGLFYKRAME